MYAKGIGPIMTNYRDHIVIDLNERGGQPCIRNSRVTVYQILGYLASGLSEEDIIARHPTLTRENIRACTAFATACERQLAMVSAV